MLKDQAVKGNRLVLKELPELGHRLYSHSEGIKDCAMQLGFFYRNSRPIENALFQKGHPMLKKILPCREALDLGRGSDELARNLQFELRQHSF